MVFHPRMLELAQNVVQKVKSLYCDTECKGLPNDLWVKEGKKLYHLHK